jgi:transposase-like protein
LLQKPTTFLSLLRLAKILEIGRRAKAVSAVQTGVSRPHEAVVERGEIVRAGAIREENFQPVGAAVLQGFQGVDDDSIRDFVSCRRRERSGENFAGNYRQKSPARKCRIYRQIQDLRQFNVLRLSAKEQLFKHHGVSAKHFPLYLKELEFRYNHRDESIFESLVGFLSDLVPELPPTSLASGSQRDELPLAPASP